MEGGLNSIDVLFTGELTTTKAAELEERRRRGVTWGSHQRPSWHQQTPTAGRGF